MTIDDFLSMVDRAISARGAPAQSGQPGISLCGVAFWRDGLSGRVSYDDAEETWDTEAMIAELSVLLTPQSLQERAARQAGWTVSKSLKGWCTHRMDSSFSVVKDGFTTERDAWQTICESYRLLVPQSSASLNAWEHIAQEAGYRVHSWDAVENGDEIDTYYWTPAAAGARTPALVDLFSTESLAWRDCCIRQALLRPLYEALQAQGIEFVRESMGAWTWRSKTDAPASSFETLADAVMDCQNHLPDVKNALKVAFQEDESAQTMPDSVATTVSS